jgi:hypothetical protein
MGMSIDYAPHTHWVHPSPRNFKGIIRTASISSAQYKSAGIDLNQIRRCRAITRLSVYFD